MNPELSVIICSRNRSRSLGKTLDSIVAMTGLGGLDWEVVIVDNDSEDDTRDVVERYSASCSFPIRYVKEERRGVSFARNRGLLEARGRLIAFTDDDVVVDKNWVRNIVEAFGKHDAACIGGKILPIWEKPKPKWLSENLYGCLALLDYGDEALRLDKPCIWGANFVVKAGVLQYYGPFDTKLGRIPGKLYAGEETDFLRRLLCASEKIVYVPDIVVHHWVPGERMKKTYFRKWVYDQGDLAGTILGEYSNRNILGVPFYIFRELLTNAFALSRALMTTSETRFSQQLKLIYTFGIFVGRLKWKLTKANPASIT